MIKFFALLLTGSFLLSNVYCDVKAFFVFQHLAGFRTDWETLKKETPQSLILVRCSKLGLDLKPTEKSGFDTIHYVDDFTPEQISSLIKPYIDTWGAQNIRIISNDEYALSTAAVVREIFDIPGPKSEDTEKFRNKIIMKERVSSKGLKVPLYVQFDPQLYLENPHKYIENAIEYLKLPIFIKPIDGASSDETSKIDTKEQLKTWMDLHQKTARIYELDEYIEGTLYHIDTLIKNNTPLFLGIGKQHCPCFDFTQGKSLATYFLDASDPEYEMLVSYHDQVLEALGNIPDGGTHLELFVTNNNECIFLEIANRTPGAYAPQCYSKMFGFPFEDNAFRLQMDKPHQISNHQKYYVGYAFFPKIIGRVKKIEIPPLSSLNHHEFFVHPGEKIVDRLENILGIAAKIMIWNSDKNHLIQDFNTLINHWPVTFENE